MKYCLRLFAHALNASYAIPSLASAVLTPETFAPLVLHFGVGQTDAATSYTPDRCYGFEPGSPPVAQSGFCTNSAPFLFSVKLPEGNYKVTVTLGDENGESNTTVKAELRRLMLENLRTARGEVLTRSFIVNVRTPAIPGGGSVQLNNREEKRERVAWDDKLTLELLLGI